MDRKPGLQVNRVSIIPVKFQHLLISIQVHQTDLRLCCGAMKLWCCHFTLTRRKINVYRWKNLKSETNRSKVRLFKFYGEKNPQYQEIRIVRLTVTFFSGFLLGGGGRLNNCFSLMTISRLAMTGSAYWRFYRSLDP